MVEAIVDDSADADDEEFEMEFDDGEPVPEIEGIPLADDVPAEPSSTSRPRRRRTRPSSDPTVTLEGAKKTAKSGKGGDDDAVAEFLLELDLDEDE